MSTNEIQELIDAYQHIADAEVYSDNTRKSALRKVNSLRQELGLEPIEFKRVQEEPKTPVQEAPKTPFNKWFK